MITVRLKHEYKIPSDWPELTVEHQSQFVRLCTVLDNFEKGLLPFEQFKVSITLAMLDINPDKMRIPRKADTLYENIFRISKFLDFPFVLQPNEDGSSTAYILISLFRNLLPREYGYRLDASPAGLVDCTLKAEQYVDALTLTDLYTRDRSEDVLVRLCETLYGRSEGFTKDEMIAVYYNFRGFLDWLHKLPQYSILFSRASRRAGGESPLGLSSSIFSLSKSGYGTLKEIQGLDVFTYLGALAQMSIDSIRQLAAAGLKPVQIADKLNLPVSEVLPHVTDNDDYEHSL